MKRFLALLKCELSLAYRQRLGWSGIFLFSLITTILLTFGLELKFNEQDALVPLLIWLTLIFAGMLQLNRSFDAEYANHLLEGFSLIPGILSLLFWVKWLVNVVFLHGVLLMTTLAVSILSNYSGNWMSLPFFLPFTIGIAGIAAVGTPFALMVARESKKDILLPILAYPILLPLVLAVLKCYPAADSVLLLRDVVWFKIAAVFALVYLTLGWLAFPRLMED